MRADVTPQERRRQSLWDSFSAGEEGIPQWAVAAAFKGLYGLGASVALVYAACAAQYSVLTVLGPHGPFQGTRWAVAANWTNWNDVVLSPLTGSAYFSSPGSAVRVQAERYGRHWYLMSPHQAAGAVMMACSVVLVNERFRHGARRKWHRAAGNVYVAAHLVSLYGSFNFLVIHTFPGLFPEQAHTSKGGVYGGSIFVLLLWLYLVAAATSVGMGVFHIARGEVQRHRSWMSLNYGCVMGAAFLRFNWACFGLFAPQYEMDQINAAAAMLFLMAMYDVAAAYNSFAHRKFFSANISPTASMFSAGTGTARWVFGPTLALFCVGSSLVLANQQLGRFGAFGLPQTPDLNAKFGGSEAVAAHATRLFASGGQRGAAAGLAHVAAWSLALISGGLLLRGIFLDPVAAAQGRLSSTFCLSSVVAAVTSCTWSGPLSFTFFLLHPEETEGHFYKLLPIVIWNAKAVSILLKVGVYRLAAKGADETRIVEWALHTFGELAFYGFLFPFTWAFLPYMPSYEDACAHAAIASALVGPLICHVVATYSMLPEPENVSAVRRGLGADWRRAPLKKQD